MRLWRGRILLFLDIFGVFNGSLVLSSGRPGRCGDRCVWRTATQRVCRAGRCGHGALRCVAGPATGNTTKTSKTDWCLYLPKIGVAVLKVLICGNKIRIWIHRIILFKRGGVPLGRTNKHPPFLGISSAVRHPDRVWYYFFSRQDNVAMSTHNYT